MHMPSHPVHTAANLQCILQQIFSAPPVHTHCSSHYIFSPHCSKSSVHLQCTHTAAVITSSVHTHCSSHYIFSAHCSKSSVHFRCTYTAAVHYIFSAHCSKSSVHLQCTHTAAVITSSVHTAATLSGSNTIQYIQCTFEPPQGKPIPQLAYLQDSQQTLMVDCSSPCDEEDWLFVAVH